MGTKTRGDTVYRGIAWSAFACSANTACVDVKDGKVLRIRPLHYDDVASVEERSPGASRRAARCSSPATRRCSRRCP